MRSCSLLLVVLVYPACEETPKVDLQACSSAAAKARGAWAAVPAALEGPISRLNFNARDLGIKAKVWKGFKSPFRAKNDFKRDGELAGALSTAMLAAASALKEVQKKAKAASRPPAVGTKPTKALGPLQSARSAVKAARAALDKQAAAGVAFQRHMQAKVIGSQEGIIKSFEQLKDDKKLAEARRDLEQQKKRLRDLPNIWKKRSDEVLAKISGATGATEAASQACLPRKK